TDTPRIPFGGVEGGAERSAYPPGAALQITADDVVLAVAIEVCGLDIDPGDGRVCRPCRPDREREGISGIDANPPVAGNVVAGGHVGLAVAVEIAREEIHPLDGGRNGGEDRVVETIVSVGDGDAKLAAVGIKAKNRRHGR